MTRNYVSPEIRTLGSFAELTNAGIGGKAEGWFPIADREG